jgi:hypothetical protein
MHDLLKNFSDYKNCTTKLLFYMAKDSFSLEVEPWLRSLEEESFPLLFTRDA